MINTPKTDIFRGLVSFRIWGTLGWHDIKQRYRRSILGPFWFTLSTFLMVGVLGVLYSTILNQKITDYLPFLAVGLIVWQFISTMAVESCNVFIESHSLIKQIDLPLTVHVCRTLWRNFLIFLHSLPVAILLLLLFGFKINWSFILLPLGLLILFLNGLWAGVILGVLCARFRDIQPIMINIIQIAFFLTPVMWSPHLLAERAWIAKWNPLYHLIELIRAPLLGTSVLLESWVWAIAFCAMNALIAFFIMKRCRNRVAYWI